MLKRTRTTLGPHFSEGARLLWLRMIEHGWTLAELRRQLKAGGGVVDRWLYGDGRPRGVFLAQIEARFGIPASLWYAPPVEEFQPPMAA